MVKSVRHTDGMGLNYFFPRLFLIISLFFEKMRGTKGDPEERGRGGGLGSSFVYTRFERQYKMFFSGYRESTVFTQVLLQIYFCFLGN